MKTITEFANKCLHEMNFGELSTTECVAKYLNLWHEEKMKWINPDKLPPLDNEVWHKNNGFSERVVIKEGEGEFFGRYNYNLSDFILEGRKGNIKVLGWMPLPSTDL